LANRDESVFANGECIQVERENARRYLSFGYAPIPAASIGVLLMAAMLFLPVRLGGRRSCGKGSRF
jgi:cytochrome P450